MLLLAACAGTIEYDGVTDVARTSLRLATEGEVTALYWIANTPVDCEPEDVEDDPTTIIDERADAQLWWLAQINGAFTREDALDIVIIATSGDSARYEVYNPILAVPPEENAAIVAYYKVREAELSEFSQYWFEYEVVDADRGLGVGTLDISDERLVGELDEDAPQFDTPYTTCENQTLRNLLNAELEGLAGGTSEKD